MRTWRLVLVTLAGLLAAAAATVLAVALNAATGGSARWFPSVDRHPLWWVAGGTVAVASAGLVVWRAQGWYDRQLTELVPMVRQTDPWVIDRPDEVNQVISALRNSGGGTVGITTAVQGAGGFGKTTIAKMVSADPRILREFRYRVHWVTIGRDTGKDALPGLINGLIAQLEPDRAVTFTDARQAADYLAAVLARGPRRLLILDDVWTAQQLAAFPVTGGCARLVTTRIPSLTAGGAVTTVQVDQMTEKQARALLLHGLPPLPSAVITGLLEETGELPLLLRLVNKTLSSLRADIAVASEELLDRFRTGRALQVDEVTGAAARELDVGDPDQRNLAVHATIQASTGLLSPAEHDRLAELAVFAEDETIPAELISSLWQATSDMERLAARVLAARLADLALLTAAPDGGAFTVHDVIRDYLREWLGATKLVRLHAILLDTVADGLPRAQEAPASFCVSTVTAWWDLPSHARYLRDHLIEHLLAANRTQDAKSLAADLHWIATRLDQGGPAIPYADLALIRTRMRSSCGDCSARPPTCSPPPTPRTPSPTSFTAESATTPTGAPRSRR